jgi:hypothetical protein
MPLTRHFYASEEVGSSLLYTTSRGIVKESVFWCHEWIQSGYVAEAISTLFESWLWHYGVFSIGWFNRMAKRLRQAEISPDDILEEVYQLCHLPIRDHSLWNLLSQQWYCYEEGWDRVTFRSPSLFPSDDPKEKYFVRALYQHKTRAAWWVTRWIAEDRLLWLLEWYRDTVIESRHRTDLCLFFENLQGYEELLGYTHEGYHRVMPFMMLMSLSLTPSQRAQSIQTGLRAVPTDRLQEWLTDWSRVLGRKAGRVYSIPYYGLYGTWGRGRMIQTKDTMGQLYDVEKGVKECPFWEEAVVGKSWEEWEDYFPDDLPDEWTRSEKEKSHGSGLLRVNETVSLWGYTRRYMMGRSLLCWNSGEWKQEKRIQFFEEKIVDGSSSAFHVLLMSWYERMEEKIDPPLNDRFVPKHKRRVIG